MNQIKPPFPLNPRCALICLLMLATPIAMADTETSAVPKDDNTTASKKAANKTKTDADQVLPTVNVSGETDATAKPKIKTEQDKFKLPNTTASVTAKELEANVNMLTVEDSVKYLPSLMVRQRYIGDTNEPLATRTTGIASSARTMIYADGVLLSTYLNNNNSNTGSPRWNTVSPGEIERADFLYGPYSAAYAGNAMGGVLNLTTKMPTKFEFGADTQGSISDYTIYNDSGTAYSQKYSTFVGNKYKDLSFRFDYSHLLSDGQPIAFSTAVIPGGTAAAPSATKVSGAVLSANSTNAPMYVYGAGALNRTEQDNFKWKFAYDITPTIRAAYTLGLWQNSATSGVQSFLTGPNGAPVTAGAVNINGLGVNLSGGTTSASANNLSGSAAAFAPSLQEQTTWSHGMSIKSDTGGKFDWELNGSLVELGNDISRAATQSPDANAASAAGQTGRTTVLTGSNWNTADAKGIWRPGNYYGNHEVSFGFHNDSYQLVNPVYNTANWQTGSNVNVYSDSEGKTRTQAYWAQDSWDFGKQWNLTTGGRLEDWNAFDGLNTVTTATGTNATTKLQTINQKDQEAVNFSPKAKLTWTPRDTMRFGVSMGQAYRYATAGELFQTNTTTVGGVTSIVNGNPNLKAENAFSSEVSGEYFFPKAKVRLSFFQERVRNAIYSTVSLLPNNTVASYVNNIGETNTYGLELAGSANDVFIDKLNFNASGTWADSTITNNSASDAALAQQFATNTAAQNASALAANAGNFNPSTGMMTPRIPTWRSTFTLSYTPIEKVTTSVSGRYSSAMFSQLNNSDTNGSTYVGNSAYFVVDTKVNYQMTKQWSMNAGINNINGQNYWIYHPFPQRTYVAQIKFVF